LERGRFDFVAIGIDQFRADQLFERGEGGEGKDKEEGDNSFHARITFGVLDVLW
jgi:hypothetical protein